MDVISNYEVITYKIGETDKYTNERFEYDCTIYYMNGQRHRENDLPAFISSTGIEQWFFNGKLHRGNDKPAIISDMGIKEWWVNGKRHRNNDKPACIYANGTQIWYVNGKLHRGNDLPAVINANGTQKWYVNGQPHRDNNKPAIIYPNGNKKWFFNGKPWIYNGILNSIHGYEPLCWCSNEQQYRDNELPDGERYIDMYENGSNFVCETPNWYDNRTSIHRV